MCGCQVKLYDPLTRAIPERIRGGLRRCAIQIDVYFTLLLPPAKNMLTVRDFVLILFFTVAVYGA